MTNEEFIKSVSLEGEEWKDIIGYEGLYAISNFGRVISFQRYVVGTRKRCMRINPHRLMKTSISSTKNGGYIHLYLRNENGAKLWYIHRLLAIHFLPNSNPSVYKEVDHIDGNPHNNSLSNLRWCSHKSNQNNPITIERFKRMYKPRICYNAIKIVRIDSTLTKIYDSISSVSKDGFSCFKARRCCDNIIPSYAGYKWMYLSDYESLINKSKNESTPQKDYQQPQPPQELQLPQQLELPL